MSEVPGGDEEDDEPTPPAVETERPAIRNAKELFAAFLERGAQDPTALAALDRMIAERQQERPDFTSPEGLLAVFSSRGKRDPEALEYLDGMIASGSIDLTSDAGKALKHIHDHFAGEPKMSDLTTPESLLATFLSKGRHDPQALAVLDKMIQDAPTVRRLEASHSSKQEALRPDQVEESFTLEIDRAVAYTEAEMLEAPRAWKEAFDYADQFDWNETLIRAKALEEAGQSEEAAELKKNPVSGHFDRVLEARRRFPRELSFVPVVRAQAN